MKNLLFKSLLLGCLLGSHLVAEEESYYPDYEDDFTYDKPILNQSEVQQVYYINRYSRRNPEMYNAPGNPQQGTLNNYYQYVRQRNQNNDRYR